MRARSGQPCSTRAELRPVGARPGVRLEEPVCNVAFVYTSCPAVLYRTASHSFSLPPRV